MSQQTLLVALELVLSDAMSVHRELGRAQESRSQSVMASEQSRKF